MADFGSSCAHRRQDGCSRAKQSIPLIDTPPLCSTIFHTIEPVSDMSLSVEMVQGTEKSWIDLSKSSGKLAALYAIQNCGYIVLKAAANTGSIEEARDNEVRYSPSMVFNLT